MWRGELENFSNWRDNGEGGDKSKGRRLGSGGSKVVKGEISVKLEIRGENFWVWKSNWRGNHLELSNQRGEKAKGGKRVIKAAFNLEVDRKIQNINRNTGK